MSVSADARQQVRIALVMNGGVSLAVWMGGVTHEINRMLRREHSVYSRLLDLTRATARVDVIAGTSAGGLNGALLAAAVVYNKPLDSVKDLWREHGSFSRLMHSPFEKEPASLMKGDEYFFPTLDEAFSRLIDGAATAVEDRPIELILTTTTLKGNQRALRDDFGGTIVDKSHAGRLTFCHTPTRNHFPADATADDRAAQRELATKLALSARSSASYPFAFEPSYIPVGTCVPENPPVPGRPDMKDHANFEVSRYAMDGGVLLNRPFRPAIEAIFRQGASADVGQVRRVLAYVVADPGRPAPNEADPQKLPTLMESLRGGLLGGPFAQSVANEISDIKRHNQAVTARRALRESLLGGIASPDELFGLGARLFSPYVDVRVKEFVDRAIDSLIAGAAAAGKDVAKQLEALRRDRGGELREALAAARRNWLPHHPPAAETTQDPWLWGLTGYRDASVVIIDLVRRAHEIAPEGPAGDIADEALAERVSDASSVAASLGVLRAVRGTVHNLLKYMAPSDEWRDFWTGQASSLTEASDLDQWARESLESWLATYRPEFLGDDMLAPMAETLPGLLLSAGPSLRIVIAAAREWGERGGGSWFLEGAHALKAMTDVLIPVEEDDERRVLNRLLALHVAHRALMVDPVVEQAVELDSGQC